MATNLTALRLGRQECKNYLLLHSAFKLHLECSVFPIQSSDVFSIKNKANKKEYVRNSTRGNSIPGTVLGFSVMQASG